MTSKTDKDIVWGTCISCGVDLNKYNADYVWSRRCSMCANAEKERRDNGITKKGTKRADKTKEQ